MLCPNFNNPVVRKQFTELTKNYGENAAYFLWNEYRGEVPNLTVEDIDTMFPSEIDEARIRKRFEERNIPLEVYDSMKQIGNATAHGFVANSAVNLWRFAEVGTEYHEEFHYVFRNILSDKAREDLYKDAEKQWGVPTAQELLDARRGQRNLSDEEAYKLALEERLAENYKVYELTGEEYGKTFSDKIRKFFKQLYEFIRSAIKGTNVQSMYYFMKVNSIPKNLTRGESKLRPNNPAYSLQKVVDRQSQTHKDLRATVAGIFIDKYEYLRADEEYASISDAELVSMLIGTSNRNKGLVAKKLLHDSWSYLDGSRLTEEHLNILEESLTNQDVELREATFKKDGKYIINKAVPKDGTYPELDKQSFEERKRVASVLFSAYNDWMPRYTNDELKNYIPTDTGDISMGWQKELIQRVADYGFEIKISEDELQDRDDSLEEYYQQQGYDKIYSVTEFETDPSKRGSEEVRRMLAKLPNDQKNSLHIVTGLTLDSLYGTALVTVVGLEERADMIKALNKRRNAFPELIPLIDAFSGNGAWTDQEIAKFKGFMALTYTKKMLMAEKYEKENDKSVLILDSDKRSLSLAHARRWEEGNISIGLDSNQTLISKRNDEDALEADGRKFVINDVVDENGEKLSERLPKIFDEYKKIPANQDTNIPQKLDLLSDMLWELNIRIGTSKEDMRGHMRRELTEHYGELTNESWKQFINNDFKFNRILKEIFETTGRGGAIASIDGIKKQAVNVFDKYGKSFRFLGEVVASKVEKTLAVSYVDGKGRLIWPYNLGSHRTFMFDHMLEADEFFQQYLNDDAFHMWGIEEFMSPLVSLVKNGKFELTTFDFDVFKDEEAETADSRSDLATMNERHDLMVRVNAYLNSGNDYAYYPIMTQSDRNKFTFVKLPRFTSISSMEKNGLSTERISFEQYVRAIIAQDLVRISRDSMAEVPTKRPTLFHLSGIEALVFDENGVVKNEFRINNNPITNYAVKNTFEAKAAGELNEEQEQFFTLLDKLVNYYLENSYLDIEEQFLKRVDDYNLLTLRESLDTEFMEVIENYKFPKDVYNSMVNSSTGTFYLTEADTKDLDFKFIPENDFSKRDGETIPMSMYFRINNKAADKHLLIRYLGEDIDEQGKLYKLEFEEVSEEALPKESKLHKNLFDLKGIQSLGTGIDVEAVYRQAMTSYLQDSIIAKIDLAKFINGGLQHYKDDSAFIKRMGIFGVPGSIPMYKDESPSGTYGMRREYNEATIDLMTTTDEYNTQAAEDMVEVLIEQGMAEMEAVQLVASIKTGQADIADAQRIVSEDMFVDILQGYFAEMSEKEKQDYVKYKEDFAAWLANIDAAMNAAGETNIAKFLRETPDVVQKFGRMPKSPIKYHRPLKMIYAGVRDTSERPGLGGDVGIAPEHDKNSDFVLTYEMAMFSPRLRDIYERMHGIGRYEGLKPIDFLNLESAKKGRKDSVFKYQIATPTYRLDQNGQPTEEVEKYTYTYADLSELSGGYINRQQTKHLRMVQVINEKKSQYIVAAKQLRKAMFAGVMDNFDQDYHINLGLDMFDEERDILTGKELFDLYQNTLSQMLINETNKLKEDLGFNLLQSARESGDPDAINAAKLDMLKRLREIVITEKFEKGFLDDNMTRQMQLIFNEDGSPDFFMNLAFPMYERNYQNIIFSLFKNRVYKLKTKGKELVQVADIGDIYYDENLGENRQLRFLDIKEEVLSDGTLSRVGHAEVMLSLDVARKLGYKPGDDLSTLDEALRRVISYRIPHQGKSSTLIGKVVGILPESYSKTIIVPGNITVVMGSDFDVDKLFVLFPEYSTKAKEDDEALKILESLESYTEIPEDVEAMLVEFTNSKVEAARLAYAFFKDNPDARKNTTSVLLSWIMQSGGVNNILSGFKVETSRLAGARNLEEVQQADRKTLQATFFETIEAVSMSVLHLKESITPLVTTPIENFITASKEQGGLGRTWGSQYAFESPLADVAEQSKFRNGAALTGIYANLMSGVGIVTALEGGLKIVNPNFFFPINGANVTAIKYYSEQTNLPIIEAIKMRLSGALDIGNSPFQSATNENKYTVNIKIFMDAISGDFRYGDLLATSPWIEEFTRLTSIEGMKPMKAFIKLFKQAQIGGEKADPYKQVEKILKGLQDAPVEVPISKMLEVVHSKDMESADSKNMLINATIAYYAGQELLNFLAAASADNIESYGDIALIQQYLSEVKAYENSNSNIFDPSALSRILTGELTETGERVYPYKSLATFFSVATASLEMASEFFVSAAESTAVFKDTLSTLTGNFGLGEKGHRLVNRALMYYLLTQEGSPIHKVLNEKNIKRWYFNPAGSNNNLTDFLYFLKKEVPALNNNILIQQLIPNSIVGNTRTLIVDTAKNEDQGSTRNEIRADFKRLLEHPEIYTSDPALQAKIKELGEGLILNALVTSGAAPTYGSYYSYTPIEYWAGLEDENKQSLTAFVNREVERAKNDPAYFIPFMFDFIKNYGVRVPDSGRPIVPRRKLNILEQASKEDYNKIVAQITPMLIQEAIKRRRFKNVNEIPEKVMTAIKYEARRIASATVPMVVRATDFNYTETDDGVVASPNMPVLVAKRNKMNSTVPVSLYIKIQDGLDDQNKPITTYAPLKLKGVGSKFIEVGITDENGLSLTDSVFGKDRGMHSAVETEANALVMNAIATAFRAAYQNKDRFLSPSRDILNQDCK